MVGDLNSDYIILCACVPMVVCFYARLTIINSVIKADMVWLAVAAVLFTVIGLFYYMRVIKVMYFDKPEEDQVLTIKEALDVKILLSVNSLSLLVLGIFPSLLMAWCIAAFA